MTEFLELPVGIENKRINGINDPKLLQVLVEENNEPLATVEHSRIFKPSQLSKGIHQEDGTMSLRESVRQALADAADSLPEGYGFVLIEGYRSFEEQLKLYYDTVQKVGETEAGKYVSDPRKYSPHVTGGAVDVALVKIEGGTVTLCDVGNNFFEHNESALTSYKNLTAEQTANRQLLQRVMEEHGFTNYPFEFWHFSIGDILDAFARGKVAKFGAIRAK
ncbi:hypothetical protein A2363_03400 [Candidatus Gottesmanbacteria bacterium RIFOXYB1_FULL_47_11]|uniref:D-Ala-D-Ala dipeptidase n=1 Tax=Candidatus Gottesmanbacteria bacterium RIFOXYB1_FULL_47_11 TaxID=1798401 RepID=A0A1F6BF33_9BACT|nr:MAG: hypothetical protein A2363_03400 [Candidatus Gottesmanbacteria bacterium RIFOXYB1_FULL_47_11]